ECEEGTCVFTPALLVHAARLRAAPFATSLCTSDHSRRASGLRQLFATDANRCELFYAVVRRSAGLDPRRDACVPEQRLVPHCDGSDRNPARRGSTEA